MTQLSLASLRMRFRLLIGLALLPPLGLMLYTASEQRQRAAVEVQEQTLQLAWLASDDQEHLIERTRLFQATLAQIPDVRHGDPDACTVPRPPVNAPSPVHQLGTCRLH